MSRYWTLSGTLENWRIGLERGVWGVSERAKPLWEKVEKGDIVVFYATHNVGVLGYGVVVEKFESREPLWPEEVRQGRALWPYRIRIRVGEIFNPPKSRPKGMLVAFAINKLKEETFREAIGKP